MSIYYTVDQVAELLNLHPKTLQRYIREGKLKATKLGKSYRITGHDLSVFTEGTSFDSGIDRNNDRNSHKSSHKSSDRRSDRGSDEIVDHGKDATLQSDSFRSKPIDHEENRYPYQTSKRKPVMLSSVVDIPVLSRDESIRIANMMTALLNTNTKRETPASLTAQFLESEGVLRLMIWGDLDLTEGLLGHLKQLLDH
jgi:excisionase family DNA binding protein